MKINNTLIWIKKNINKYRKFIINASWTTLNQIITVIFAIMLSVIFARLTSKELFGEYNFLISIMAMMSIIAIPGLNTSMLRSISRGMDGVYKKSVKLSFIWSLLGVPILFFIGCYYYFYNNQIMGLALFIASVFFPFMYAPNNWTAMLQGKKKFDIFAKYSIIQSILRTSLIILTIFSDPTNLILIFLSYLGGNALTNVVFYLKCVKYLENEKEEYEWKKSGYKLTFNDFVSISYEYMDKILIGIFLGPSELAVYAIAVSIVSAIKGSLIQILKVIYPSLFAMSRIELKTKIKKTIPLLLVFNVILLIIVILLLPPVIIILYSQKYADSIFFAQLYSITLPLVFITSILSTLLISIRSENILLASRLFGFTIIIVLYFIMIPIWGVIGAIAASIIYYIILCVIQYHYLKKGLNED